MTDPTKDYLGSGWKFPLRLDSRGQVELVHQEADVEEAIRMILTTNKGERPMRPEFGSELYRLQFAPNDAATSGLAARYVQEALLFWEPRIDSIEVNAAPAERNEGCLLINVNYRIRATNSERNLVFPFYTIPGND